MRDKISLEHVFEILQQFEKASGLRVNEEKTEAYWLGSNHNCMLNLSIRTVNEPMTTYEDLGCLLYLQPSPKTRTEFRRNVEVLKVNLKVPMK